jgi:hypothetical protein
MLRTQIYLTEQEKEALLALSEETGLQQSALIREAIDQFIAAKAVKKKQKQDILRLARGMWSNHENLPNVRRLRDEFERG